MNQFNVPADFQAATIDRYASMNAACSTARVAETYGNMTRCAVRHSGRAVANLPSIDLCGLADYVRYSHKHGIEFSYTLNAIHMQNREFTADGVAEIKRLLHEIHNAGVRRLIVTLPQLIEIVRSTGLDMDIKASVLCQVINVSRALTYRRLGVKEIVADESICRDFGTLHRIAEAFDGAVEVIVNPICHKDCHYRIFHYNQMSCETEDTAGFASNSFFPNRCLVRLYEDAGSFFRTNWIRPEDLKHYVDVGITHFKTQGRHNLLLKMPSRAPTAGDMVRVVQCYFDERYEGDLNELLFAFNPAYRSFRVPVDNRSLDGFLKPFVESDRFCRHDCPRCGYCDRFGRKVIDERVLVRVREQMREFFCATDPFRSLLWADPTRAPVNFPL